MFTKSCGLLVVLWLLLMGAYGYLALGRVGQFGPAVVVGILGGTFSTLFISAFIGLFTGGRDRAALRRAATMEPRQDGRIEAASGPIRATGTPLEAPFSGQACVAYDYDVKPPAHDQSDFYGVAMTPCAVETMQGPARVLGWALLDQFSSTPQDKIDRERGTRYLMSTTFEPFGVMSILSTLNSLLADDDGTIRRDFRIAAEGVNLQGRRIKERLLPAGTVVTMLGDWSEARGGFVHGSGALLRFYKGDLEATRKAVGGNTIRTFAIATFFFVVLHAMLVPAYMLTGPGRSGPNVAGSVWDERDCDKQKTMLARGANPNEAGPDALTPLMNAARMDDPACVSNLIAAGARLDARDKLGDTALAQAVRAGRDENVKVLLAAGAKDFRVSAANGRPVKDGDGALEAVREYHDALFKGDFETMARLMAHSSVRRMEDSRADLPMWQSRVPKDYTVEGWVADDAATITIRGRIASGDQRVVFHVERQDLSRRSGEAAKADGWQIQREWFPDER